MSYGSDANRQVAAHLFTAGRHLERDNHSKAEEHLIAATQLCEAHGIPHFGRYSLQQITRRAEQHKLYERERALKDGRKA